jgi:hypothetical protein
MVSPSHLKWEITRKSDTELEVVVTKDKLWGDGTLALQTAIEGVLISLVNNNTDEENAGYGDVKVGTNGPVNISIPQNS